MNSTDFLIQCYFGDVSNPTLAAIDRAYLDMQAHTVSGDKYDLLFPKRKDITEILYGALANITLDVNFDEWHKKLSKEIKDRYHQLSYGQIQKWLNMSVKYLVTLKKLGVENINDFWSENNASKFHAPLDSYVLDEINKKRENAFAVPWRKIESYEEYLKIRNEITFEEEYDNWPKYVKNGKFTKTGKLKKAEKGTYERYLQDLPTDKKYKFEGN